MTQQEPAHREELHSHSSEGTAAAAGAPPVSATPLATLLTQHILRDGELVLLILKPSLWFIVLSSLRFGAGVAIVLIGAKILQDRMHPRLFLSIVEGGIFLMCGWVMWAILQWMGRLYILTDMRIVRLSGVFTTDIFDCPLRKVARTRVIAPVRERILGLGSIEIIPYDDAYPIGLWQTISKPRQIHETVVATINKAKQGGMGCA